MGIMPQDLGIDMGTSTTKVYVKHKGVVVSEPSLVAVDPLDKRAAAFVGEEARQMLGRNTEGMTAVYPMREGEITDFDFTRTMLKYFKNKAIGPNLLVKPRAFLSCSCNLSSLARRALVEAARSAGCRKVYLIDKPMAAALGSGLPVFEPTGCMVVDIGAGTADAALIASGGTVISHSVRVGSSKMDECIIEFFKREYNVLIGERAAEDIKLDLASALPFREERRVRVRGRDMTTSLPHTSDITSTQVYDVIHDPCRALLDVIKWVLQRTPPDLAADVMHKGIYLTGGGSQLYGLDQLIATEFGIPVLLAKDPAQCAALGLGYVIENLDLLQQLHHASFLKTI